MLRAARTVVVSAVVLLLALSSVGVASAAPAPTMPVSELKVGMTGVGRTVIRETLVEDFDVEIVGILERGGFNGGPMILVRGSGPVLDATGGFAGGYSGSPVFIDGKMIGAISAAWYFADHSIAGVTPIDEMLKNFAYPAENEGIVAGESTPFAALSLEDQHLERLQLAQGKPPTVEAIAADAARGTLTLTPCRTPLFVNGLSPALVEQIQEKLGPMMPYMDIMPGIGISSAGGAATADPAMLDRFPGLEPGSAVGAQLVAGDIDLTAIGTLTYVDDERILAFGHPFLQVGAVELPLTKARIVHTMKSIQRSFKMGEAVSLVGKIDQDRASGISGHLGTPPHMIPFHLTVSDTDLGRVRRYDYSVIDYEAILPYLGLLPPTQGMAEVMDRQGPATIRSHFKILTEELEPIERTNMFYDQFSGVGVMELVQALFILTTQNIFQDIHLKEIFIDVEVTQNRQTTDIMKAEFLNGSDVHAHPHTSETVEGTPAEEPGEHPGQEPQPEPLTPEEDAQAVQYALLQQAMGGATGGEVRKFKPGETITVEVMMKPYRQPETYETLRLKIPADTPPGQTTLEIRGGGRLPSIFQMSADTSGFPVGFAPSGMPSTTDEPPTTLEDLLETFKETEHTNDLVMELYRPGSVDLTTLVNIAPIGENEEPSDGARADTGDDQDTTGVRDVDGTDDPSDVEPIKTVVTTDRVIFGTVMLPVEIVDPNATNPDHQKESESSQDDEREDETETESRPRNTPRPRYR